MDESSEDSPYVPRKLDFTTIDSSEEEKEKLFDDPSRPKYPTDVTLLRVTPRRLASYVTDDGLVVPCEVVEERLRQTPVTHYVRIRIIALYSAQMIFTPC